MPEPDVAVILPYRDAVKYLPRCVNSIINQTFQNFELILINDGSTDGSREFAESVRDPRIRIIDLPAAGLVAALNEGIFSTKARYLALLDPYDTARPDRLEKQYHYFELHEDIEVVSSRVRYLAERAGKNLKPYIDWTNRITRHEEIYNKRFVNSTVLHSTLMFKRELINTYGSFEDGEFPEDYEILLRWMNEGVSFAKLDDELTEWHDDVQRLSRRHTKYNSEAASKIKSSFSAPGTGDTSGLRRIFFSGD